MRRFALIHANRLTFGGPIARANHVTDAPPILRAELGAHVQRANWRSLWHALVGSYRSPNASPDRCTYDPDPDPFPDLVPNKRPNNDLRRVG